MPDTIHIENFYCLFGRSNTKKINLIIKKLHEMSQSADQINAKLDALEGQVNTLQSDLDLKQEALAQAIAALKLAASGDLADAELQAVIARIEAIGTKVTVADADINSTATD